MIIMDGSSIVYFEHLTSALIESNFLPCTMVEDGKKHRQNSHLIIHFLTNEGVSEVSERANEWAQRRAGAKQAVSILVCSRPRWGGCARRNLFWWDFHCFMNWSQLPILLANSFPASTPISQTMYHKLNKEFRHHNNRCGVARFCLV